MAKKFSIEKGLKKAKGLMNGDAAFRDVLKQIASVSKQVKPAEGLEKKRLRVPYVDAVPLVTSDWK